MAWCGGLDNWLQRQVETMNGLLQQVKRAAPGLSHGQELHCDCASAHGPAQDLPQSPFKMAEPCGDAGYCHA